MDIRAEIIKGFEARGELTDDVLQAILGDGYVWDGQEVVERGSTT